MSIRDVLIVGAGPTGLSAAIAAKKRGLDYQVLEQGTLVNSIYRFPAQMVFFTTPELLEIGGLPFVSPYDKPTRTEGLRYYRKVVDTYDLQIAYGEQVLSIEREAGTETAEAERESARAEAHDRSVGGERGWAPASSKNADHDLFAVTTRSSRGVRRVRQARAVVLAIGYFDRPVMLGVPGEDLPHVHHYYSDPHPYYRQRVVVVGGGNSAAEWSLELYRAGASVTLVHRGPELKSTIKYWVRPDIENRIKEGAIAAHFNSLLTQILPTAVTVSNSRGRETGLEAEALDRSVGGERGWAAFAEAPASVAEAGRRPGPASSENQIPADAVFLLTGYRADVDLMRRAGIELTDREGPHHNPETFETNVPNLFVAGGAIAGVDTGTIFIENGRFHGEKIIEVIAQRVPEL